MSTMPSVSPRKPNVLPDDVIARLRKELKAADQEMQAVRERRKAAVTDALKHGSIRQVAAATGMSPTTVQAWSKGLDR